jgi:hypothetical protein
MLRPAQHEEDAPRAPPFMTGAEISRFDNSVGTARYRSQIEVRRCRALAERHVVRAPTRCPNDPLAPFPSTPLPDAAVSPFVPAVVAQSECKANARMPRSDRAPPWALHDPTAYDDPTAARMAAMAAAPSSAASAPPTTAPLSKAQPIGTSGVHTLAYSYAQPPVGYLQPQQPVGAPYMMMQPPPLLLLPAMPAGAQPGVARRGQPQQPLTWQQQPPLASFPGDPGPMYVLAQPGVGPMGAPIPYGYAYGRQC